MNNSNKRLIEGIVSLLREQIGSGDSGFSESSEYQVPNVWGKNVPVSVQDEFPRGGVDIISGNDFELSVDLSVRLREVVVKIVVFGESSGKVEELIDDVENTVSGSWDQYDPSEDEPYLGDWSFRNIDGFTELNETGESEGDLTYSRSVDIVFETIKHN